MRSIIQEELFGPEQYTRLCSFCRGEFPRSVEFFPEGHCNDGMASFCRKCSHIRIQLNSSENNNSIKTSQINIHEKLCKECDERKPLRDFYMSSHTQDGKTSSCRKCIDEHFNMRQKRKDLPGTNYVFFIQDSRNKRVKISSGNNPYIELQNLQQGSSESLHILASFETGLDESAENMASSLQSLFQTHHSGNGWFDLVPSLDQYIYLIKNGDSEKAKLLLSPINDFSENYLSNTASKKV
tara:strand:+ start:2007 stop:2726 length:720 start_codon:yes stop_codon:yes gene_type:complete